MTSVTSVTSTTSVTSVTPTGVCPRPADMGALRVLVAVVVALSTVVVVVVREAESSCVQARLCCQGKDTTCVVKGERVGAGEEPAVVTGNGTCFCDAGCLDIGDCCADYKDQCRRKSYAVILQRRRGFKSPPGLLGV